MRLASLLAFAALLLTFPNGCAARAPVHAAPGPLASPIEVPEQPSLAPVPRSRVASGLDNPRGMLPRPDGALLVSLAGTGDPSKPASGRLVLLEEGATGSGSAPKLREKVLLDGQNSANIIDIVRRDEVFGLADIATGDGLTLVSLGMFGGPSTIYRIDGNKVTPWSRIHGNINDLAYDPSRKEWMGVSSSSDEIVELEPERGARRITKLAPLSGGQDAVPGYLRYDPASHDMLVTLFSGSTQGEEGGSGTELVKRAGGIVRVDPDSGNVQWVITGLTAPTDLEIGPDGRLYVLEFCSDFEEPVSKREDLFKKPTHGGFRRFSGRLLRIDPRTGEVVVLAEGLDAPTNLALRGHELYIAQGMGTPGRPIPGPSGTVPLEGFIEKIELPDASVAARAASDA